MHSVRVSRAKPKTSRFDLIVEGDQIRECTAFEYQGRSRRREFDVCICGCAVPDACLGKPRVGIQVRETINRGRSQRTNNHVKHPGIVGEA